MLHHRNPVKQIEFMREVVDRLRVGLENYVEKGEERFPIYYHGDSYWLEHINVYDLNYDELLADVVRTFDKSLAEIDQMRNCIENLRLRG
jgi:hypothetical protein